MSEEKMRREIVLVEQDEINALKSCPFCGSDDIEIQDLGDDGGGPGIPHFYRIVCDCGAEIERKGIYSGGLIKAVEAWNTRHSLA